MTRQKPTQSLIKTTLICSSILVLAGCTTTTTKITDTLNSMGSALAYEAEADDYQGPYTASDLKRIENTYKSNNKDPQAAIDYARVLREFDYLNRAAIIIRPFAQDPASPAETKAEYAAILLASGNYTEAEEFAKIAIRQEPENYDAYHYLGIALDAQGEHEKSEKAFRKGLNYWEGNPTPIMNNLALNLASQGYFTESIALLERAVTISPDRLELMRNLRIVQTLQETSPEKKRDEPVEPIVLKEDLEAES